MAMSTIEPIKVQMMKLDNGNAYLKLRDNVTSTTKHNELLDSDFNFFNFDELDLQVTYVENIEQLINDNFATYWTLATEQINTKKLIEEKQQQILNLIDNGHYKQLGINMDDNNLIYAVNETINSFLDLYFTKHPEDLE